ncbi:MAG: helix-turn-helix domain-containing protein [Bacteroidota bacterium]
MTAKNKEAKTVRSLQDGRWYWAPKAVIQEMSRTLGFLALAVYHFLSSMADSNQACFPSQAFIAERLGCCRTSVTGAIKTLESNGLLRVIRDGKSKNSYELLSVRGSPGRPPTSIGEPLNVNPNDTNDIRLTRIDTNGRHLSGQKKDFGKGFKPTTKEEVLACDLANELNEPGELQLYLSLARTYSEPFLRETLAKVNQTPRHRIKKSRAALFTYLVHRYGKGTSENLGG